MIATILLATGYSVYWDSVSCLLGTVPATPERVIFLGDSITAGWGAPDKLDYASLLRHNESNVWPEYTGLDLTTRFGELRYENLASPGATISNVLERQLLSLEQRLGPPPWEGETVVIMTIGGNDLYSAIPHLLLNAESAAVEFVPEVESRLADVLAWLRAPGHFEDDLHVYMTNVYEPTDGVGLAGNCLNRRDISALLPHLERTNLAFRRQALAHDVVMVDLHNAFLGHGHNADDPSLDAHRVDDPSVWFAADCIHPNQRGHHEVRRLFWSALQETWR